MTRLWIGLAMFATLVLVALAVPAWQGRAQMLAYRSPGSMPATASVIRVEADLARKVESWHGASACASPARARSALAPVLARWLGGQVMAHPGKTLIQWGYRSGDVWSENRIVDGRPGCSAGFRRLIAHADFR